MLAFLIVGGLAARGLSNLVRGSAAEAGITNANFLAKLASVLVWAFAIVVAVNQIGIASALINTLFMAFVGALALAAGLAFGLGGRDTASQIVRDWYETAQQNRGKIARTGEKARAAENAGSRARRTVPSRGQAAPDRRRLKRGCAARKPRSAGLLFRTRRLMHLVYTPEQTLFRRIAGSVRRSFQWTGGARFVLGWRRCSTRAGVGAAAARP